MVFERDPDSASGEADGLGLALASLLSPKTVDVSLLGLGELVDVGFSDGDGDFIGVGVGLVVGFGVGVVAGVGEGDWLGVGDGLGVGVGSGTETVIFAASEFDQSLTVDPPCVYLPIFKL